MNFNESLSKKSYYSSLKELKENKFFSNWLSVNEIQIDNLKKDLFDSFFINEIFIINESLEKNVINYDRINVLIEFDKSQFEKFVDSKKLFDYPKLNIICKVNKEVFYFDEEKWVKIKLKLEHKVVLKEYKI